MRRQRCVGSLSVACDKPEEPWGPCKAEWQNWIFEDESWAVDAASGRRLRGSVQAVLGSLMRSALTDVRQAILGPKNCWAGSGVRLFLERAKCAAHMQFLMH